MSYYNTLSCALFLSLVLTACTSQTNTQPDDTQAAPTGTAVPAASKGKELYESNCAACHGDDGTAGISGAADLKQSLLNDGQLQQVIQNGKGSMPAFNARLSADETTQLVAYLKTFRH